MWRPIVYIRNPLCVAETDYVRQRPNTCMCSMATLFLAMIANCMFFRTDAASALPALCHLCRVVHFRTEDETTLSSETITVGPLSLSPQEIGNSLLSSLIVFPSILMIAYFFSKSVPKSPGPHRTSSKPRSLRNPLLPHWFAYIAWLMVSLSMLVSACFTILYCFEWGREKCTAWLTAFLLSCLESVVLIQPLSLSLYSNLNRHIRHNSKRGRSI